MTREEKRLQNEQDERENWALLEPGQLQREEGEDVDFGVRDYSADDLEKDNRSRDYTFHGLGKGNRSGSLHASDDSNSSPQGRESDRPANQTKSPRLSTLGDEENLQRQANEPNPFRSSVPSGEERRLGAHIVSELDLRGMLRASDQTLGMDSSPGDPGLQLRQLLGGSISGAEMREHDQRMDNFRALLNSQGVGASQGSLNDAFNTSMDRTRQPLHPITGSPAAPSEGRLIGQPMAPGPVLPSSPAQSWSPPSFQSGLEGLRPAEASGAENPTLFQPNLREPRLFSPLAEPPKRKF